MSTRLTHTIMGGTFDHFHIGHRAFLGASFEQSEQVTVGITTSALIVKKEFVQSIESYEARCWRVREFAKQNGWSTRLTIIPLHDIYGNGLSEPHVDAIFVTDASYQNGVHINSEREKRGLSQAIIVNVPLVRGPDGHIISSTRIRRGEIDSNGNNYYAIFDEYSALKAQDLELLGALKSPVGEVVSEGELHALREHHFCMITVGDVVSATTLRHGITPELVIYDLQNRRKAISEEVLQHIPPHHARFENPQGTILSDAARGVREELFKAIESKQMRAIQIDGEEDLLVTPAVLCAPLGSVVLYGLPDIGIIAVPVTPAKKHEILHDFAMKMTKI